MTLLRKSMIRININSRKYAICFSENTIDLHKIGISKEGKEILGQGKYFNSLETLHKALLLIHLNAVDVNTFSEMLEEVKAINEVFKELKLNQSKI